MNGERGKDRDLELQSLRSDVRALEMRVAALEGGRPPVPVTEPAPAAPAAVFTEALVPRGLSANRVMGLLGRSLLVLAGAFLLRALTDWGTLPTTAGFGLGLVYALALTALADRAGGRSDALGGNVHGVTALLVAFPFVWETTAVRGLVSPVAGGLALAVLTAAGLAVAWHRRLRFQYWTFTLAGITTAVALYAATGAAVFYSWLLLALGVMTLLFSYGRGWYLARWPAALVADGIILRLAVMSTNPDGARAAGQLVPNSSILLLTVALLVVYLGIFVYRALVQGRGVKAFDVVQSLLVVAVGFGGAAHIAGTTGGSTALGWSALVAALTGYTAAFTVVRQRHGRGRAFFYFATLAMLFLVLGSRLLTSGRWLAWSWIALGVTAAYLGGRYDRVTLRAHSAVYLALAALGTGLFAAAIDAFVGDPAAAWSDLGPSALVALSATCACYMLLTRTCGVVTRARRVPRFLVAVITLAGIGYVAVALLVRLASAAPPDASPAVLAVVRTAVLAVTAVGLAWAGRYERFAELGWLVYPLLAAGCAKLVFEDLTIGNPVALTVGFALFGTALILAPRIRRRI